MTLAPLLRSEVSPVATADPLGAVVVVDQALSPAECAALIEAGERLGFDHAPITVGPGRFRMAPDIRNNTRVILDDPELAAALWDRLGPCLPVARPGMDQWRAVGLNERFRWYRYVRGQAFRWHRDGAHHRSADEISAFSVLLYLNQGFEGGDTEFGNGPPVAPATGRVLAFFHGLLHQGAEVRSGVKYVLRTDLMFARTR